MPQSIRETTTFDTRLLVWRLLTLAWAAHIFLMSTKNFGGEQTRSALAGILHIVQISVSTDALGIMNAWLRKFAHMIEYAILAFFLYRSMGGRNDVSKQRHLAILCVGVAAAYSFTDELHQLFVVGRNGSLGDWCIDTAGAAMGMLVLYVLPAAMKTRTRRRAIQ